MNWAQNKRFEQTNGTPARTLAPFAAQLRIPLIVISWSGIVISHSGDRDHAVGAKRR
jgi:hypothetical protein